MKQITNYRLYMDITNKGENTKIVTQDVFISIYQALAAVYNVLDDISNDYQNIKPSDLMLMGEPHTQEDGITYVAQIKGTFTDGKFLIRIITTDNEPEQKENVIAQEIQGRFMELIVDELGEFKFLFKDNIPDDESQGKYLMEAFWNPPDYGIVDFLEGHYVDDIDLEIENIKENMSYYIDGARISCESHIENKTDDEGVYQDILDSWFNQEGESK